MMDDSGTLPVPIGAGGNRALSTLDQLAEIPEEDIWLAKQRAGDVRASSQFAADSPVEGTGFEPSVPRQEKWSMPSSSDQTRVGRTLTLGGGAESSLEGRYIELSVSPKDIRPSPYDLCANRSDRRQSREGDRWFESGSLQQRVTDEPVKSTAVPSSPYGFTIRSR